jgi:hypothetical protein
VKPSLCDCDCRSLLIDCLSTVSGLPMQAGPGEPPDVWTHLPAFLDRGNQEYQGLPRDLPADFTWGSYLAGLREEP